MKKMTRVMMVLSQVNLKSCCVVPEQLSTFAKENKVQILWDLLSSGEISQCIAYRQKLRSPSSPILTQGNFSQGTPLGQTSLTLFLSNTADLLFNTCLTFNRNMLYPKMAREAGHYFATWVAR